MKQILQLCGLSLLLLLTNSTLAQSRTEYLDAQNRIVADSAKAKYTRNVVMVNDSMFKVSVKHLTGEVAYTGAYIDHKLEIPHGDFEYFYANGYKESQGRFKNGYKVGTWKRWSFDGNPKPDRYYPDENFRSTNRTSKPAKFPGGMTALQAMVNDSLKYPLEARERKIEGTVYVTFTIDATGEVTKPQVTDGVHYLLDEEALRFVSSLPTWTPAAKNGMPVDSNYIMPITFNLGMYNDKQKATPQGNAIKN
ncbi:MAG: energy transducer TonB [Flavobacteriales bacterium]|nr:energy transducer TonB [Flavobacteriales bacterium]